MNIENLRGKTNPKETLQTLVSYSESIKQTALEAQVMLDAASEKEINVDEDKLNNLLDKFESQMVMLRGNVLDIKSEIASSGLQITPEDMEERLKKTE